MPWATNPDLLLLATVCRELQAFHGANPFFISYRTVQRIFGHETHDKAARWMRSLCVMKVIKETEKGKGLNASRYRYLLQQPNGHAPSSDGSNPP